MKKYIILDENNIVINVLVFAENHNEDLEKIIKIIPSAKKFVEILNEEDLFGVGLIYNEEIGKCMPAQPYPSWIWDEIEWTWICPIEVPENPENKRYFWDEDNMQWLLLNNQEN